MQVNAQQMQNSGARHFCYIANNIMPKRKPKDDRLWMLLSTHTGNLMMSALGIIKFFIPIQYHQFIFRLSAGSNYISLPNDVFFQLDLN